MRCQWLVPGHSPYLFCFLRNGHNPYLHLAVKSLEFLSMLATGNCIGIPHNSKILVFLSLWRIKYHLYGEAYLYFLMSNNSIFFSLLDKRSAFSYIWELELYAGKAQIFFCIAAHATELLLEVLRNRVRWASRWMGCGWFGSRSWCYNIHIPKLLHTYAETCLILIRHEPTLLLLYWNRKAEATR
jgi:hypothetical protein